MTFITFLTNCYYTCDLYYICDQLLHLCLQHTLPLGDWVIFLSGRYNISELSNVTQKCVVLCFSTIVPEAPMLSSRTGMSFVPKSTLHRDRNCSHYFFLPTVELLFSLKLEIFMHATPATSSFYHNGDSS